MFTDPQAASVGEAEGALTATVPLARCRAPPPTRATTTDDPGFMTLVSDGERLTGAYALGPEAGEWLQQATLAIRARVPLDVMQRHDPALPDLLGDLPARVEELGAER